MKDSKTGSVDGLLDHLGSNDFTDCGGEDESKPACLMALLCGTKVTFSASCLKYLFS